MQYLLIFIPLFSCFFCERERDYSTKATEELDIVIVALLVLIQLQVV